MRPWVNRTLRGLKVKKALRLGLQGLSKGYKALGWRPVFLAPQWIKERGIFDMRVRVKVALYSVV